MNLPYSFGTPTPDGGLQLHEAERKWLAEVLSRIDTAFSEIAIPTTRPPPEDYIASYSARALAEVVSPFAVVVDIPQTDEDEARGIQKKRASVTIIKGGLPPRPVF